MAVCAPRDAVAGTASTAMRIGSHPGGMTRFVLDLTDHLDFTTAHQADPYRIIISSRDLQWRAGTAIGKFPGSVSAVRFDDDGAGGRIIVDLREPATVKSAFVIPPRDGLGWRFVMDMQTTSRAAFMASVAPVKVAKAPAAKPAATPAIAVVPTAAPAPPVASAPSRAIIVKSPDAAPQAPLSQSMPVSDPIIAAPQPAPEPQPGFPQPAPQPPKPGNKILSAPMPPPLAIPPAAEPPVVQAVPPTAAPVPTVAARIPAPEPESRALSSDGKPVVVIDPGHGGADPGAIGVSGVYEKYITLSIARELKAELEKNGRFKVYLTRDRDVFIRLRDRVAIARQFNADLFLSLHADSVANPQLRGLSVYTLSQNASDTESQALADKENKADLIAGVDLSHESADVANILIDLAQRETMNRSASFATGVVDEAGRDGSLLGNTHRFAGFAVLKAPDVPSVLVEMGYLSNEAEERQLRQPEYRTKLAKSLSRAVDRYFVQGQKAKRL